MRFLAAWSILLAAACGCVDGAAPKGAAEPDAPERALYAAKCTACHRLYDPASRNAAQWPAILDRMAVKAKLTDEEEAAIRRYVSSFAR